MQNATATPSSPPRPGAAAAPGRNGPPPPPVPAGTIGSKFAVGVTGLLLSLFVLAHMLGNLQVFLGAHAINAYAHFLQSTPELLWAARTGLLVVFVVHLVLAVRLRLLSRSARSQPYAYARHYAAATVSSRSMLWTGLALFFFVIYHLAHFTGGLTQPQYFELQDPARHHDVYSMVVWGFRDPLVTGSYVLAMVFLGLHMWHGVASTFQSMGVNQPRWRDWTAWFGKALTVAVVVGDIAIPTLILLEYYAGLPVLPEPPQPLP